MKFESVLGSPTRYSFGDAVLAGWGDDGGMLVPEAVPRVSSATLSSWATLSYPQLLVELLKLFIPASDADVTHAELDDIVTSSFARFGSSEVVELKSVAAAGPGGSPLHVLELWHGPTCAFKDLGMSVLGATLAHLLARRRARTTLLVGTSGDTGSSAIEAVRGRENIEIVVLYPLQGFSAVTPVQERQMTSVSEANVHVVGVEGTSDDLDVPMEACFRDANFRRRHSLGSVNSVNVVRLLVQSAHFFYAYLRLTPHLHRAELVFSVPCGAAGHLAAGLLAVQCGLPARLIAAANTNDALHRLLSTGVLRPGAPTVPTASPSMDIQVPYNVWRVRRRPLMFFAARRGPPDDGRAGRSQVLHAASGGDAAAVRGWQRDFAAGELRLPAPILDWLAARITSRAISDAETLRTMREVHAASGYLLDPHTAVAVAAAASVAQAASAGGAAGTVCCLGCAHPVKFTPSVAAAFGVADDAEALRLVPDVTTHRSVAAVAALARSATRVPPAEAEGQPAPPGCTTVLRRGEDWEARLRGVLEGLRPQRSAL